ncbi:MAG TPA: PQQ-binding-like beta-propeller repeat protein [Blastocatellia bacterium]|nr:PQQ-binding-like beta-propeller repeat protein [Blastocatellia bacterium]
MISLALLIACPATNSAAQHRRPSNIDHREWRQFGGNPDNTHYSTLRQINCDNVHNLKVAWTFDTEDAFKGSEMQCNPIIINGILYATTPKLRVIALDAGTGKMRWSFDPNEGRKSPGKMRNRGLMYWDGGTEKLIYFGFQHWLYALDAKTGQPVKDFGVAGHVDLRDGLGRDPNTLTVGLTTPGVVYKDLLIVGSIVSESLPAAPGHIRAYDARTGKLRWIFHTIPQPGEFGYETWPKDAWQYIGGANSWGGLVLDEKLGLVFAPTGSAAFDFYGANRLGDNLFANTLLCLDARTGRRVWHFQAVKHDVWDRDFPAAPALVTVKRGGRLIDAVAQITKSGHVFVFERATGKSLFPIEYRKASASDVDGERLAETQPLPMLPLPFARQELTEDSLTRRTPEAQGAVLERFRAIRSKGQFEPPSLTGTVVFPGFDGGGEWGGASFDPVTGLMYVNSNEMAWILRLVERRKPAAVSGKSLYVANCASCHKVDLSGSPPEFPSLAGIGKKYADAEILDIVRSGMGRMPGFSRLGGDAVRALTRYVLTGEDMKTTEATGSSSPIDLKYSIDGYNKFLDPDGYPAVAPPWGTLTAIDLNKGEIVWQIPFGEYPELVAKGIPTTGSENYGGAVVTAGGLLFIGATDFDKKVRAFDKRTGKLLWETVLPAAGNATPATYEIDGWQYVVVAAGGGKSSAPTGGSYVAFALPRVEGPSAKPERQHKRSEASSRRRVQQGPATNHKNSTNDH